MSEPVLPNRLEGRVLFAVRAAWTLMAVILAALALVGCIRAFRNPQLVALPAVTDLFSALGLNLRLMLGVVLVGPLVVVVLICVVVVARRSDDPMALLSTMTLLALYTFGSRSLLTYEADSMLGHAVSAVFAIAMVCLGFVFALFPDGRFVPRSARWLGPAVMALFIAFPDTGRALMALLEGDIEPTGRIRTLVVLWSTVLLIGVLAQVHRYRHLSGSTARQQAKWVMAPIGLEMLAGAVALAITAAFPATSERWVGWVILLLMVPASILLPVMWANAILRYRLYEIDRVISRTVAYGLLTGLLAAVYLLTVMGLQRVLSPVMGDSQLAVAGATLVVAALFQPARRRIQAGVDRRFNRARYDAQRTVDEFRARLRDKLDIDELTTELVTTADGAVAPATVQVWLRGPQPLKR